jgi:hypothetical protein
MFLCNQAHWTYSANAPDDRVALLGEDFSGIVIEANIPRPGEGNDRSRAAAELLSDMLKKNSNIESMVISRGALPNRPLFPPNTIFIHVGMKPIPELFSGNQSGRPFDIRGNVMSLPE